LPGEQEQIEDTEIREGDTRAEAEYQRRTEGVPVVEAAAIAVEISADRRKTESAVDASELESPQADLTHAPAGGIKNSMGI
jgi:carbamoylphosphate synthase large subunit